MLKEYYDKLNEGIYFSHLYFVTRLYLHRIIKCYAMTDCLVSIQSRVRAIKFDVQALRVAHWFSQVVALRLS